MASQPALDLAALSLAEVARLAADQKLPPIDRWDPHATGDSEMRIARDGRWYHQDAPISRPALVALFASLLRREPDGRHVLITPVEKLDILVEDAPFVAVEMKREGKGSSARLGFRLNTDDWVIAGPDNRIRFVATEAGPRPYLHVRRGLEALVSRAIYYEMADIAVDEPGLQPGVWSSGAFFALEPTE